jgi:hypothetical protein
VPAPEVIYLQDGDVDDDFCYEETTWCADQIDVKDTKYIRYDIHLDELRKAKGE